MEVSDIALATAADALASVLLEQVCDALESELRAAVQAQGVFMTGRYAPGYGDCPLSAQRSIVNALNATRLIGLTVTPTSLLMPTKSVTAVIGLFDGEVHDAQSRPTCNICQGTYEVVTFRGFQICRECFLGIREEVEKLG